MDDRDGLKEELGWLKVLVVLAATLEFSLSSWVVNASGPLGLRVLASLAVLVIAVWLVQTWRRAEVILRQLKRRSDHEH